MSGDGLLVRPREGRVGDSKAVGLLAVALLAFLPACPPQLEEPERFQFNSTCNLDVEKDILQKSCAAFLCHDSETAAGSLDLSKSGAGHLLFGVPVVTEPCRGAGFQYRIDPADGSGLLEHLLTTDKPACSTRMPQGGGALPPEQLACLKDWIRRLVYEGRSANTGSADTESPENGQGGLAGSPLDEAGESTGAP